MNTKLNAIHFTDRLFETVVGLTAQERLLQLSAKFLGMPYLGGALGEGEVGEFDQFPFYRFDAFDCVTYINTVLALYFARSWHEFLYHLAQINYRSGNVRYENRYHFMSIDWNPENNARGYVTEITPQVNSNCAYAVAKIDRAGWLRHHDESRLRYKNPLSQKELKERLLRLHFLADSVARPSEDAYLPYIPLTEFFHGNNTWKNLPPVAIVEIVRPNWDLVKQIGTHLNVSHVGFLLTVNGEPYFRHASQQLGRVVDQPLREYLAGFVDHPTIKGINLQAITAV